MTELCVSIFVRSFEQTQRDVALAAEGGAQIIELRIDEFEDRTLGHKDWTEVGTIIQKSALPIILTCRPTWEGGSSPLGDADRIGRLKSYRWQTNYIDCELRSLPHLEESSDGRDKRRLIVSAHDFTGRPDMLFSTIQSLNESPADVIKLAWMARSIRDNIEAFEILLHRQKPTIALCMGEAGLLSRVLAKKFGAFLSFASLAEDDRTAPGQLTIDEMKNLYRWDAINSKTKVYGVVGSPVKHSMSPAIHNAAFASVGHDGVYLPMLVEPSYASFKAFMEEFLAFKPLDLAGLSITIPHKENALRYLKQKGAEIEPLAERIGAVNTIVIGDKLQGFNTDYSAILDTLTHAMNISRGDLANYRVAVIGAGGTGRAAAAALAACGATVVVYNRTRERADALAAEFDGKTGKVVSARLEKLCDSCCHIFVNTTSVGMQPNSDESPLGDRIPKCDAETLVMDCIYNPSTTKLLRQAERAGAKTVGGVEMFLNQAAKQFELWIGKKAPVEVMRRVISAKLSG